MRWDSRIPRERIPKLEAVVDQILGVSEESVAMNEDTWLRAWLKSECVGFITEAEIKEVAESPTHSKSWLPINVTNALLNAIDIVNNANYAMGIREDVFTNFEMQLMRQEFIERFAKRLNRYNKGYRLNIKEWDSGHLADLVGFRWE